MEKQMKNQYFPGYRAAQKLGISSHLVSRITGTLYIQKSPKEAEAEYASKVNVGLNLKNNKRNEEVCGFTRKNKDNNWEYSSKALDALRLYMSLFPEVFEYLSSDRLNSDFFHQNDVFGPESAEERLKALSDWIKDQAFSSASRQPCGTLTLDESIVSAIEKQVESLKDPDSQIVKKKVVMQLKPHLIFKPVLFKGSGAPDQEAEYRLYDRVVNVREGFSVPLGLRGTVIGVLKAARAEDFGIEVLFDDEFQGGLTIRSSPGKCYRVSSNYLFGVQRQTLENSGKSVYFRLA